MVRCKLSLVRIGVNVASFFIVGITCVVVYATFSPIQRGFFCDDETIQYPYHGDTVSSTLLSALAFILPCVPIFILEAVRLWLASKEKNDCTSKPSRMSFFKKYCEECCTQISVFLLGTAVCILITEFLKLTVGRLRPHFIDLCQPDPTSYNCSDGYITSFQCTSGAPESTLKNARKSFPSGHSSMAVFAATYLVMYLQIRLPRRETFLLRPMLQTLFILGSLYVMVSRISDNKHHWSDVLAGSILGLVCAVFTVMFVSDLWTPIDRELSKEVCILPMAMTVNKVHAERNGNKGE